MTTAAFDYDQLLKRCMGMEALVTRIISKFDSQIESDFEELEEAIRSLDLPKATELAHRMKGTSLNVTALEMGEIAAAIEQAAKGGDIQDCQSKIDPLRASLQRFRREVSLPIEEGESQA